MITLHDWFTKKAKRPLAFSVFSAVLFWVFSVVVVVFLQVRERNLIVSHLSGSISMAYTQKNRVALESLAHSAVIALKLKSGAICDKETLVVGVNANFSDCRNSELTNIFILTGTEDAKFRGTYTSPFANLMIWLTGLLGLLFVLVSFLIMRSTQKAIIKNILQPVKEGLLTGHALEIVEFEEIRLKLDRAKELEKTRAVADAIDLRNKQIAHDVRSPLAALNMIIGQLKDVPEHQRLILRSSTNRINDIANTLLNKSKEQKASKTNVTPTSNQSLALSVELLPALADNLISEKRIQFRDKIGIDIEADLSNSYGAFVNVNGIELSRLLSNTINNAIEAFAESKGKIVVSINKTDKAIILKVADNGKGIPKHILERLGQQGVTHGKEGTQSGSGLGVYHAKKTIEESFGGKFEIQTEEGKGTTILMSLPVAPTPKWFVEKLSLAPDTQVVSIDDDLSIHSVWKGRFQSLKLDEHGIEHLTFTSGDEFKNFYQSQAIQSAASRRYLVDYELLNQNITGLEIIETLGIGQHSILVTSRYEEKQIKEKCEQLAVRLIPKGMAGFVPIEIKRPKKANFTILIDDDVSLIHTIWKMAADAKGKSLATFAHPDEFLKIAQEYDPSTPMYIDSNLGNGLKGEVVAKKIFEMGFNQIYICTGYDPSEFTQMPWIKGVVGKDAPW